MATGTLMPAPAGRETKSERQSRELQNEKYLQGLYAERAQMDTVASADSPASAKAARRLVLIDAEIKRCGGTVPPRGGRGRSTTGDGSGD